MAAATILYATLYKLKEWITSSSDDDSFMKMTTEFQLRYEHAIRYCNDRGIKMSKAHKKITIRLLKMAHAFILQEDKVDKDIQARMLVLTLNNLGCFYVKQSTLALSYFLAAYKIEQSTKNAMLSGGRTCINICISASALEKHDMSLRYAREALHALHGELLDLFKLNSTANRGITSLHGQHNDIVDDFFRIVKSNKEGTSLNIADRPLFTLGRSIIVCMCHIAKELVRRDYNQIVLVLKL